MTLAEVAEVLNTIKYSYLAFRVSDEREAREMLQLWHKHLADVPAEIVNRNLSRHISSERFAPTIAELREGYSADHERLKLATQDIFAQQDEARRVSVPPPPVWYTLKRKLFGEESEASQ